MLQKLFNLQHCVGDAASPEVLSQQPSIGSGVQPPIISMEDDEMSDQEVVSIINNFCNCFLVYYYKYINIIIVIIDLLLILF